MSAATLSILLAGHPQCIAVHDPMLNQCGKCMQAEKQRIDGMRSRWLAETRRKAKARDAERRAAAAAENAKTREKPDTEDVVVR